MTGNQNDHNAEDVDHPSWDELGQILERFSAAWESAPPAPDLESFVPASGNNLRTLHLIELVKADMEYRSQTAGTWRALEDYVRQWPEISFGGNLPPDLILEEHQIKQRMDQTVQAADMLSRFPDQASELSRIAGHPQASSTVSVFRARHLRQYEPGQTIDDFDLLTRLGRGAFATVFLARQNSMQRLVALKISADQGLEPQTLAQLDHPSIVRVFDQRVLKKERVRLMYMQFVPGGTLAEVTKTARRISDSPTGASLVEAVDQLLIAKGQTIPDDTDNRRRLKRATWAEAAAHIGAQLADALDYAHQRGVLHRDMKPANILIDAHCNPKIVDFNISFSSKIAGASPASYFGGSLAFMSPEQLEATSLKHDRLPESLDGRSDLYALGVILFEFLTNQTPFDDTDSNEHWSELVPNMIDVRRSGLSAAAFDNISDAPQLLHSVIDKALAPSPEDRFQSGSAMAKQLTWSTSHDVCQYLGNAPGTTNQIRAFVNRFPFLTLCVFGFGSGLAAVWFIYTYNLIQSVPFEHRGTFDLLKNTVNIVAFAVCIGLMVVCVRDLRRCLQKIYRREPLEPAIVRKSLWSGLHCGTFFSATVVVEWAIAGCIYPVVLSLAGVPLEWRAVGDFIVSHFLAGITMGAYLFCATTATGLACWIPHIIRHSLDIESEISWRTESKKIAKRLAIVQILAVAAPMLAVMLIVNLNQAANTFAVGVLSVVALLGLVLLVVASRLIQQSLRVLEQMEGERA